MSYKKSLQHMIGVTLVMLLLVGCGAPAATPVPPTATPVPPTATPTPELPTSTFTPIPPTPTSVPPTATPTPEPPTPTRTPIPPTPTPVPPTVTPTPVPPTATPTPVPTTGKIVGALVDKSTQEPVASVKLRLVTYKGLNAEGKAEWYFGPNDPWAESDASGDFSFSEVSPGEYSIWASFTPTVFPSPLTGEEGTIILEVIAGEVVDLGKILVEQ